MPIPLSAEERAALAERLPTWRLTHEGALARDFLFADFSEAWGFMSRVALLAEAQGHHPDWSNGYNRVSIRLITHEAGGLTAKDVALAHAIDAIAG